MRATSLVGLMALLLMVTTVDASRSTSKKRPQPAPRPADPAPQVVEGFGRSQNDAREAAQKSARDQAQEQVRERFAGTGWEPPEGWVDAAYLTRVGVIAPEGEPQLEERLEDGTWVARYRVALTRTYLTELASVARREKEQERHLIVARVLLGLLSVLLVVGGYLRLEEMTRGYATRLLRLAVVMILSLVGLGLWLTW